MTRADVVSDWIRAGHMVRCGLPPQFVVLHHPGPYAALWLATQGGTVSSPLGLPRSWRIAKRSWRPLLDRPNGDAVALALGYGFGLTLLGGGVDPLGRLGPLPLWASILEARCALRPEERARLAAWGAFEARPQLDPNRSADAACST